jgi:hypothetical protein
MFRVVQEYEKLAERAEARVIAEATAAAAAKAK